MAKRIQIGDVVELRVKGGLAYAQVTHKHEMMGHLMRALPGIFEVSPKDLGRLVEGPSQFIDFLPAQTYLHRGELELVGNYPVPAFAEKFPLFRCPRLPGADPSKPKGAQFLWDGAKTWRVGELLSEHRKLPYRAVSNLPLFIERIESGWSHEGDQY